MVEPQPYRELFNNAGVHRHWTIQVGFHRLMVGFSPSYGVQHNDRYAEQRQPFQR